MLFYYTHGHHKQYIQAGITCYCMLYFGLQGHVLITKMKSVPFFRRLRRRQKGVFNHVCEEMLLKSKMKNEYVYMYILLMVSIYVIRYR